MNFVKPPFFLRWIYPQVIWNRSRKEKVIYLTFDDGPIPEITPWILDVLKEYQAKATFFCVGENIDKYSTIFDRIKAEGHQVGNHTYNHLRGWDHEDKIYFENIEQCNALTQTNLLRPPYLRATRKQLRHLQENYEIIYFDVLSCDYDIHTRPERCFKNVDDTLQNGSIVVFHDNLKAIPRLTYTLPRILKKWTDKGFRFDSL